MKCDECDRRPATVTIFDTPEDLVADMPYVHMCAFCAVGLLAAEVAEEGGR